MRVGIIGAGNVGTGLTKHLVPKGHSVMLSFSGDAEQLKKSATALAARAGSVAEAVRFADIVVLATPWTATSDALKQVEGPSQGKVFWDCTNALPRGTSCRARHGPRTRERCIANRTGRSWGDPLPRPSKNGHETRSGADLRLALERIRQWCRSPGREYRRLWIVEEPEVRYA